MLSDLLKKDIRQYAARGNAVDYALYGADWTCGAATPGGPRPVAAVRVPERTRRGASFPPIHLLFCRPCCAI